MLLEFTVGNFLSFKDKVTLNLSASGISEYPENVSFKLKRKILKRAAVYGANSSGKSNLLNAMAFMRSFIRASSKMVSTEGIDVTPFLLNDQTATKPSFFEALFIIGKYRYRYGFEVNRDLVAAEWLYRAKAQTEKPLFVRIKDQIDVMKDFSEGEDLEEKTRDNALFLSIVDQFNGKIAKSVMKWFSQLNIISGVTHDEYRPIILSLLEKEDISSLVTAFLKNLDLGFRSFQVVTQPFHPGLLPSNLPQDLINEITSDMRGSKIRNIETIHKVYNNSGDVVRNVEFNLRSQESSGTNKLFDLLGPVFSTLTEGGTLVVDELGAKMHSLLTRSLISLFISEDFNTTDAQLVFATHDTNLLTYGDFRRDQIYFIEKDHYGASSLYSLLEYKEEGGETIRKGRPFEKDYMMGRYGGIPQIGDFSNLKDKWLEKKKLTTQS